MLFLFLIYEYKTHESKMSVQNYKLTFVEKVDCSKCYVLDEMYETAVMNDLRIIS